MSVPGRPTAGEGGLRVAIVSLTRGGLSGGARKYLEESVPRLVDHPLVQDVRLFLPESADGLALPPGLLYATWPARDKLTGYRRLRAGVAQMEPCVVLVPTARWLNFGTVPTVAMVRNMEPLIAPIDGNSPTDVVRNLGRRRAARTACDRATRLIAVSGFVRQFLVSRWRVPEDRIAVVHHGVTPVSPGAGERPTVLQQDPGPFIFAAGSIRPARGLEDLIVALRELADRQIRCNVLVAGESSPSTLAYERKIHKLAVELGVAHLVTWVGQLSRNEMAWCLGRCLLYVTTSRTEACPNTLLEAMSHGCRCVASDIPPMREFLGGLGYYYPLGDGPELARRLEGLLRANHASVARIRRAVTARALEFSWERTVARTLGELTQASATRPIKP